MNATFLSVTEQECGITPDGAAQCRWRLTFQTSVFVWQHSDVGEAGFFICSGGAITAQFGTAGRTIMAAYDPASQTVIWEGLTYVRE